MTLRKPPLPALLLALLLVVAAPRPARCEESLNAYVPATHKVQFDAYNALVLGDLSVAKAAFRGPVAVQGKAELADFDIAASAACNKDARALTVARSLSARMGSIHAGYTVLGRGSNVHHSVRMSCTNRVEQYDPVRNDDIEFDPVRSSLIREAADMCVTTPTGLADAEPANDTMLFKPGDKGYSCYTFFRVTTDQLRLVKRWVYDSDDYYRNLVIVVSGLRNDFRDFRMERFNPRRTLVVFCAVYGSFGLYNAKLQASILAPTATFTAMDTIVNGSIIVGGLRGSIATLSVPYVTC